MDIGKPQRVLEIEEPAVPYRGVPVPSPERKPERAPAEPARELVPVKR